MNRFITSGLFGLSCGCATIALASPSSAVSKPPLNSLVTPLTGPSVDPTSSLGQWFLNNSGVPEYRSHEFYDNIVGDGGSPDDLANNGHLAIRSSSVTLQGTSNFTTGFSIRATIFNNTPNTNGVALTVDNAHGESPRTSAGGGPDPRSRYVGTLYDTKLTAEFGYASTTANPGVPSQMLGGPPYFNTPLTNVPGLGPVYARAVNHDQRGWYCWNPNAPQPGFPAGDFMVPTWDFGDIPVGASAVRDMQFDFTDFFGAPVAVPNSDVLIGLLTSGQDLFLNRTTDVKIGDFFDVLNADGGVSYNASVGRSGNVSVFHNVPEPAALMSLAAAGLVGMLRPRRRSGRGRRCRIRGESEAG